MRFILRGFVFIILVLNFTLQDSFGHVEAMSVTGPTYAIVRTGPVVWTGGAYGLKRWSREGRLLCTYDIGTVYDLSARGGVVYAAGSFGLDAFVPNGILWHTDTQELLRSVLVTPDRVYAGGRTLYAFTLDGQLDPTWAPPVASTDQAVHSHTIVPAFRDLVLWHRRLIAACQCDSVNDSPTKALVAFGGHGGLLGWPGSRVRRYPAAFGISVIVKDDTVYAGFGGSDSVEAYDAASGRRLWRTDVTGSAQVVTWHRDTLMVGGHFRRVADDRGEACHHPTDPHCYWSPHLFVMGLDGSIDKGREPSPCCAYNGVWSLMFDHGVLWIGGEFSQVGRGWYAPNLTPREPVAALNLFRLVA